MKQAISSRARKLLPYPRLIEKLSPTWHSVLLLQPRFPPPSSSKCRALATASQATMLRPKLKPTISLSAASSNANSNDDSFQYVSFFTYLAPSEKLSTE